MPITQDRMITLINAARDCQAAVTKLKRVIHFIQSQYELGRSNLEISAEIESQLKDYFLFTDPNSPFVIEAEYKYFRRNAKRNAANTAYQWRKRRGINLPALGRAPDSDFAPIPVPPSREHHQALSQARARPRTGTRDITYDPDTEAEMRGQDTGLQFGAEGLGLESSEAKPVSQAQLDKIDIESDAAVRQRCQQCDAQIGSEDWRYCLAWCQANAKPCQHFGSPRFQESGQ